MPRRPLAAIAQKKSKGGRLLVILVLGVVAAILGIGVLTPGPKQQLPSKAETDTAAGAILDRCRPLLSDAQNYEHCLESYARAYVAGIKVDPR